MACIILGFIATSVLLVAALAKLVEGQAELTRQIMGFAILPPAGARHLARALPAAELSIGISLLIGFAWPFPGWIGIGIYLAYSAAIVSVLLRGKRAECGCFGRFTKSETSALLIVRNLLLAAMLIPATLAPHPLQLPNWVSITIVALTAGFSWFASRSHSANRFHPQPPPNTRNNDPHPPERRHHAEAT